MAKPVTRVDDGNFKFADFTSAGVISYPFGKEGDFLTWEWAVKGRIAYEYYNAFKQTAPLLGTAQSPLGIGYLIDLGSPTDVGSGLFEFTLTFGNIPHTRVIGQVINATFTIRAGYQVLAQFQKVSTAQLLYEYGTTPFSPRLVPEVRSNILAQLYTYGDWYVYTITPSYGVMANVQATKLQQVGGNWQPGQIIVGQDSDCGIYKGPFYYRKTYFVTYPNIQTLQNTSM